MSKKNKEKKVNSVSGTAGKPKKGESAKMKSKRKSFKARHAKNIAKIGAHCSGHNRNSIGICYAGGVEEDGKTPKDTRTENQKDALLSVLYTLKAMYPEAIIYSHNEFANKACPSFDATNEYKDL